METDAVVKEQHSLRDYLYWNLMLAVPLLSGAAAVFRQTPLGLAAYLLVAAGAVAVVYRHFCSHCPHYTRARGRVKCLFFWGMPKIFPERTGPMSAVDKALTGLATAVCVAFPLPWLVKDTALLLIYTLSAAALVLTLRRSECHRCAYRDCPANCVDAPRVPS
jgi:hypothetical protein